MDILTGHYFWVENDATDEYGFISTYGRIVGHVDPGYYLVDYLHGARRERGRVSSDGRPKEVVRTLVPVSQMVEERWNFYTSAQCFFDSIEELEHELDVQYSIAQEALKKRILAKNT